MSYTKIMGEYLSSNGKDTVKYYIFTPDKIPSAVIQISHGMNEHIGKYENEGFVRAMTDAGFVVCGNDHIGHGGTAPNEGELGHFPSYKNLVSDLHILNGIMRKTYRSLPYVLLGHSMGSFIARAYVTEHDDIDGAIFSATSAGNQPLKLGIFLASCLCLLRGKRHRSKLLRDRAYKGYNSSFSEENKADSWLSADDESNRSNKNDRLCRYVYSVCSYREIFKALRDISSEEWAQNVPISLPVYLISGDRDPLGENGKGIEEVFSRLEERELCNLSMKLCKDGRHSIFTDVMKDEVFLDVIKWVNDVACGVVASRSYEGMTFGRTDFNI